jgi:hypothetical protein
MKTKLLKKVRKRYSIIHYPNGVYSYGSFQKGPVTVLRDNIDSYKGLSLPGGEKDIAFNVLYDRLKIWISQDYKRARKRKVKTVEEKLWYI